jgi:hypothetical protein
MCAACGYVARIKPSNTNGGSLRIQCTEKEWAIKNPELSMSVGKEDFSLYKCFFSHAFPLQQFTGRDAHLESLKNSRGSCLGLQRFIFFQYI